MPRASAARLGAAVLAVALAWRIVLAIWLVPAWESAVNRAPLPDRYPLLAQSIVEGGPFGFVEQGARPSTLRGPGFPLWLAAGMVIGGDDPRWLGCWTALLPALAAALVAGLAARRYGRLPGLVAGAITGLHPIATMASARTMSDEFFAALAVFGVLSLVAAIVCRAAGAGLGVGCSRRLLARLGDPDPHSGVLMLGAALPRSGRGCGAGVRAGPRSPCASRSR